MTQLTGEWKRIEYLLLNPAFQSGFRMVDGLPMVNDDAAERAQKAIALAATLNQHGKPVAPKPARVTKRDRSNHAADFDIPDWER